MLPADADNRLPPDAAGIPGDRPILPVSYAQVLAGNGVIVGRGELPPQECEVAPFSYDLVMLYVGAPTVLRQSRESCSDEETILEGGMNIIPAWSASRAQWAEPFDSLHLHVKPEWLQQIAAGMEMKAARVELMSTFTVYDPQVRHLALALKAEMDAGLESGPLYADSLFSALAARLLTRYSAVSARFPKPPTSLSPSETRRVLAFIQDNLVENLPLAEIAAVAHYSPYHFTRLFKQATGYGPHQYVIRARVERAAELLATGRYSVSQAAALTAFSDAGHLARHFRRVLGIAPGDLLPHTARTSANPARLSPSSPASRK